MALADASMSSVVEASVLNMLRSVVLYADSMLGCVRKLSPKLGGKLHDS